MMAGGDAVIRGTGNRRRNDHGVRNRSLMRAGLARRREARRTRRRQGFARRIREELVAELDRAVALLGADQRGRAGAVAGVDQRASSSRPRQNSRKMNWEAPGTSRSSLLEQDVDDAGGHALAEVMPARVSPIM